VLLNGVNYCTNYADAYHTETTEGIPVAIIFEQCAAGQLFSFLISHEVAEAATDPRPSSAPAWMDPDFYPGEVADLCIELYTVLTDSEPGDGGAPAQFVANRLYSVESAQAGTDPCVPVPAGQPRFGVGFEPRLTQLSLDAQGHGTGTTELLAFGDPGVGAISWKLAYLPTQSLSVSPSSGVNKPGERVTLTVTSTDPTGIAYGLVFGATLTGGAQTMATLALQF
jgi:hypothetical protein